jgi:uncharacterized protein (DUF362 family)
LDIEKKTMKISRRTFCTRASVSAAGLLLAPYLKSAKVLAYSRMDSADILAQVGITQANTYDRSLVKQKVQHLFESIGGIGDVVGAGDKVAIKINLTGGSGSALSPKLNGIPITESMWTHPEVVRAVGELLIDAGVSAPDITIVEALWDSASYDNFGYLAVQQSLGAQRVNLNAIAPYPDFVDLPVGVPGYFYSSFRVNRILSEVDVYVSIPKMKEHYEAGVTASLKNQVGMVPKALYVLPNDQGRRGALHGEGGPSTSHLPRSVSDLNLARPVHLAIIDGVKNARGAKECGTQPSGWRRTMCCWPARTLSRRTASQRISWDMTPVRSLLHYRPAETAITIWNCSTRKAQGRIALTRFNRSGTVRGS